MGWFSAIAGLAGAVIGGSSGSKSAKAQAQAAEEASRLEHERYLTTREDLRPFMEAGYASTDEQLYQLGLADSPRLSGNQPQPSYNFPSSIDLGPFGGRIDTSYLSRFVDQSQEQQSAYSGDQGRYGAFYESPGYQFLQDEALDAVTKANAAGGRRFSGPMIKEAARYAAGLASQEYGNYFARLQSLSGGGQTTATNLGAFGLSSAANQSNGILAAGMARGSAIMDRGNAISEGIGVVGSQLQDWWDEQHA